MNLLISFVFMNIDNIKKLCLKKKPFNLIYLNL